MRRESSSGKRMGREKTLIKENPRSNYKAARRPMVFRLILALRQRQLPMNQLSCGTQSAYISLINRRRIFSLPFPLPGG